MDDIACSKCGQMLFGEQVRASLIRCKESACPLKAERKKASRVILASVAVTGLIVAGLGTGLAVMFKPTGATVDEVPRIMAARAKEQFRPALAAPASPEIAVSGARMLATGDVPADDGGGDAAIVTPTAIAIGGKGSPAARSGSGPTGPGGRPAAPAMAAASPPLDTLAASAVSTFKCSGRLSGGRRLVCSDQGLAIKDYNLSLLFRSALQATRDPAAVRAAQALWLQALDTMPADRRAVLHHYRKRAVELSSD